MFRRLSHGSTMCGSPYRMSKSESCPRSCRCKSSRASSMKPSENGEKSGLRSGVVWRGSTQKTQTTPPPVAVQRRRPRLSSSRRARWNKKMVLQPGALLRVAAAAPFCGWTPLCSRARRCADIHRNQRWLQKLSKYPGALNSIRELERRMQNCHPVASTHAALYDINNSCRSPSVAQQLLPRLPER